MASARAQGFDCNLGDLAASRAGFGQAGARATGAPYGLTYEEIARRLGISSRRVRQLEERALAKMRAAIEGRDAEPRADCTRKVNELTG